MGDALALEYEARMQLGDSQMIVSLTEPADMLEGRHSHERVTIRVIHASLNRSKLATPAEQCAPTAVGMQYTRSQWSLSNVQGSTRRPFAIRATLSIDTLRSDRSTELR